jgi:hypothetical protein
MRRYNSADHTCTLFTPLYIAGGAGLRGHRDSSRAQNMIVAPRRASWHACAQRGGASTWTTRFEHAPYRAEDTMPSGATYRSVRHTVSGGIAPQCPPYELGVHTRGHAHAIDSTRELSWRCVDARLSSSRVCTSACVWRRGGQRAACLGHSRWRRPQVLILAPNQGRDFSDFEFFDKYTRCGHTRCGTPALLLVCLRRGRGGVGGCVCGWGGGGGGGRL